MDKIQIYRQIHFSLKNMWRNHIEWHSSTKQHAAHGQKKTSSLLEWVLDKSSAMCLIYWFIYVFLCRKLAFSNFILVDIFFPRFICWLLHCTYVLNGVILIHIAFWKTSANKFIIKRLSKSHRYSSATHNEW